MATPFQESSSERAGNPACQPTRQRLSGSKKGGFVCEFVEKLPKAVQTECPVCLQILRVPYLVSCCGYDYCKTCIEQIQEEKEQCPTCKKKDFTITPNKGLQQALYKFRVYCTHKQQGCEWTGELGQLNNHLNPPPDKQLEGCPFITTVIECQSGHEHRTIKNSHQPDLCPKTPLISECSLINCDFHHVGCDMKLPRKDMPTHLKENLVIHMSLLAASYGKRLSKLEIENQQLREEVSKLTSKLLISPPNLPCFSIPTYGCVEFTMSNFKQHLRLSDVWFSPPFYTHPQGYKMCLRVDANGSGRHGDENTHVSVYINLMRGEFDDHLKWPFRGDVTIEIVDQKENKGHHSLTIHFTDKTPIANAGRVIDSEKQLNSWGHLKFISHGKLQTGYLKNDSLCFRISMIILKCILPQTCD